MEVLNFEQHKTTKDILKLKELIKSGKIAVSPYVEEWRHVKRSLMKRLFTRPWRPFKKFDAIYTPVAYKMPNGTLIIGPYTAKVWKQLIADLEKKGENKSE